MCIVCTATRHCYVRAYGVLASPLVGPMDEDTGLQSWLRSAAVRKMIHVGMRAARLHMAWLNDVPGTISAFSAPRYGHWT